MSEGEFKNRLLYGHRSFQDLYFDREERIKQVNIEVHPDPLLDYFVSLELVEAMLDEAAREFPTYEMARKEYLRRVDKSQLESGLDAAGVQLVLNKLRSAWLLKWFGETVE